jgi:hypothetical protein
VLIGTNAGLVLYNVDTKVKTTINKSVATGLAYDETTRQFMELEADGTFSVIALNTDTSGKTTATKVNTGMGYTELYDTTDGFLMTIGGLTVVSGKSGTKTAANGEYGMIQLKIS